MATLTAPSIFHRRISRTRSARRICCAFRRRAASTTASRRSSGGCSTTRSRSTKTRCGRSKARAPPLRDRSISRCSPTACAPSANRASPSMSPIATSRRRGASSSSPTRRATSSTRATWPRAHRLPMRPIVLIDASKGVLMQSRRHAYIASLLRVRHVLVAVNKMDLIGYDEDVLSARSNATSGRCSSRLRPIPATRSKPALFRSAR